MSTLATSFHSSHAVWRGPIVTPVGVSTSDGGHSTLRASGTRAGSAFTVVIRTALASGRVNRSPAVATVSVTKSLSVFS